MNTYGLFNMLSKSGIEVLGLHKLTDNKSVQIHRNLGFIFLNWMLSESKNDETYIEAGNNLIVV